MSDESKKSAEERTEVVREQGLTYDDYAAIDSEDRFELSSGTLEMMSAPSTVHQLITSELYRSIHDSCHSDFIIFFAPVDVILSKYEVRQPDVVIIRRDRMNIISKRGIEGHRM